MKDATKECWYKKVLGRLSRWGCEISRLESWRSSCLESMRIINWIPGVLEIEKNGDYFDAI